jgi:NSS family neurotransmitter:Na+ symporter
MPALFFLLLVLVGYSATTSHFGEGLEFLFSFNVDKLDGNSVLIAMGQAFFTLSLGMGAIMTYGAYMPRNASIAGSATIIALLDTAVALLAGMAIFPLVFANGLESSSGPGLMFVTLPLAFGQMGGGVIFGTLFFLLVTFAAITSAISLMEPALSWLIEHLRVSRVRGAILVGGVAWILGLGSAFSTNIWSELYILPQMTIFDTFDYVSNNIMLPVGGMLIALFAGWVVDQKVCEEQLQLSPGQFAIWQTLVRFVAPAAVGVVFVVTLFG